MAGNGDRQKLEKLERWLREHGGYLNPSTKLAQNEHGGVHLQATNSVSPESSILTIPHSLALSYLNAIVDDACPVFKAAHTAKSIPVESIGFFYLCFQWIARERSFWQPYHVTLPKPDDEHYMPLCFGGEDGVWLEGTDVAHEHALRLDIYRKYHSDGLTVLDEAGIDTKPYTWELFIWAIAIFTSRAFPSASIRPSDTNYWTTYKITADGRRQTVLLDLSHVPAADKEFGVLFPVLDALNHKPMAKVDWSYDPGRFGLTTRDTVEPGGEVFNNYGGKPNGELLLGYGFCIENNSADRVLLTLRPPTDSLQSFLQKTLSGYFEAEGKKEGDWRPEAATFKLARFEAKPDHPLAIFHSLPEALLELFLLIVFDERSALPAAPIETPLAYLTNDHGTKYLPHVTRKLVESLIPKLSKLHQVQLPNSGMPQNQRQRYAKIYRDAQIMIMQQNIAALSFYLQSCRPQPGASPSGSCIVTIEEALALWQEERPDRYEQLMTGIQASTNSDDPATLVVAGWEDELWALFLCFMRLSDASASHNPGTVDAWGKALIREHGDHAQLEAVPEGLMDMVLKAREAVPKSVWWSDVWSEDFIAAWAGRILRLESMVMNIKDGSGVERPRAVAFMHADDNE